MVRTLAAASLIGLFLPTLIAHADSENAGARFAAALSAIDDHARAADVAAEKLEDEYLALLSQSPSGDQTGLVYGHIGLMYASLGPKECDAAEAYCLEALRHLLPLALAGRMHVGIANAIRDRYAGWGGLRWPVGRRRVASAALEALRALLDSGAPKAPVRVPTMTMSFGNGPPEYMQAAERQHQEEVAAREKADALNDLQRYRTDLVARLASLYSRPPFAPDELRDAAAGALAKYPEVVQEIMSGMKTGK